MRVFITGGTGLIGGDVARRLAERGDTPVVLSRNAESARKALGAIRPEIVEGDPGKPGDWQAALDGCDAVVHLAGHSLFGERWTEETRRKIRDSRVHGTENVVAGIERASKRPSVLVQGSAIGYYGPQGDEALTEDSPPGDDFLAQVCIEWEAAARPVEGLGVRLPIVRTGLVLAENEGALKMMVPLFRLGPGMPVGSDGSLAPARGRQWMSWIHLDDMTGLILLALDHPDASGPLNATAPHPVRNGEFSKALSRTLWRPYAPWRIYLPFGPPDFVLRMALGDIAEIVTSGQRVLPERALGLGYTFQFPELDMALGDLLGASRGRSRTSVASSS